MRQAIVKGAALLALLTATTVNVEMYQDRKDPNKTFIVIEKGLERKIINVDYEDMTYYNDGKGELNGYEDFEEGTDE